SVQFGELGESEACLRVIGGACGERDQDLVCVKTRVPALQIVHFQFLDRLNGLRRDDVETVIQTGEILQYIQQQGCRCSKQVCRLPCDDPSVFQFDSGS